MSLTLEQQPLGQHLLQRQLIASDALDAALQEQERAGHEQLIGEILVDRELCTQEQILQTLAFTYGVPFARITPRVVDPFAIALLGVDFLEKHQVLPLFCVENTLTLAVAEPANIFLLDEVARLTGRRVQLVVATPDDIATTLQAYLPASGAFAFDCLYEHGKKSGNLVIHCPDEAPLAPQVQASEAQTQKLLQHILYSAAECGASAIHIEPMQKSLRVRFRIDGHLFEKLSPPAHASSPLITRIKTLANAVTTVNASASEGSFYFVFNDCQMRAHLDVLPGRWGDKLTLRLTEKDKAPLPLEKLAFNYDTLKAWRKMIATNRGLILVTGPTGNGIGSTLFSTLAELDRDGASVCTLERHINVSLPGINQFQLAPDHDEANVLQSILAQDADVVMIRHITDAATARLAAQAAMDGRLIIAGLGAPDSPGAIKRLLNLGIEPYVLASSLRGVLAQRLVRKLCPHCKVPHNPTLSEKRQLEKYLPNVSTLQQARACGQCHQSGYAGRLALHELLPGGDALGQLISQNATAAAIGQMAAEQGIKTLRHDGMEKVASGITTLDEVIRATA